MPQYYRPRGGRRYASLALSLLLVTAGLFARVASSHGPAPPFSERKTRLPEAASDFKNFESPHVHPLALTPDRSRLLAVNSPNGTLSVFQLTGGAPTLTAEIPVGLDPVSVAVRNDREAWVVNWLSDSVSIVDLGSGNVVRTIDVGDEPTDVLFAGLNREMAFVCVSGGNPEDRTGRGQVKVFDPSNLSAPPQVLNIFGKQPHALAKNANGSEVYVSVFESGNQTTIVSESQVRNGGGPPPPSPALRPGLPAPPTTSLIVRWNGTDWVDESNRSWNSSVPYRLADVDLVVLNASGNSAAVGAQVRGLGTHVSNMAFDPVQSRLLVSTMDSTSATRFEPNLRGRFQSSRVSILSAPQGSAPTLTESKDLNPHVDFGNPSGTAEERALSLALPADIARSSDGTIYVAATSSARVGFLAATGVVQGRIAVGAGPTGLAVDDARQRLYVLNRFDHTLSVVDTNTKTQTAVVSAGTNPEPAGVRAGRKLLYDANFSAHGTVSCASCHQSGHRDGLAWDLGDPQGNVDVMQGQSHHPMKGPMVTQTLRGITGQGPMHWRGDRANIQAFNPAFTSLLGATRQLTAQEMDDFDTFIQTLVYPPNPMEPQQRVSSENQIGFGFFSFERLFGGQPTGKNCVDCHTVRNFGTGTDGLIISALDLKGPQSFKTPQLRGLYQKTGMDKSPGEKITGFGFAHDGSFDTMFNFQKAPVFNFSHVDIGTADSWRRDMEQMMLRLDSGTPPAVGLQTTVNADNKTSFQVLNRINLLMQQATIGNCDLIVRGLWGGSPRGFLFSNGSFKPDSDSEAAVSMQTLVESAGRGAELTFTGVPAGTGRRYALDRDGNNVLNDDEPRPSVQISGRVVDASGNGVPAVTVTLGGTQSSVTQTDATGKFIFGFVSTTGTYSVTPAGVATAPASRTITNPKWNQTANFVAPPGAPNAIDATHFFVRQHYNDFFNREPDAAGLAFWVDQIESCGANAGCRAVRKVNVSGAFYLSTEFQETGFIVYRMTEASFNRMPSYAEFFPDQQRLGRNVVVNVGDWEATLARNKDAFFAGWVSRPTFRAAFDLMSNVQYVDTLLGNAGLTSAHVNRDALVAGLGDGSKTRAGVLREIVENQQFKDDEKNRAFVLMQYLGYMRRNPQDPPEETLDLTGFNFWLRKLNEHNGNFVEAEMVNSFLISSEYRERFKQ